MRFFAYSILGPALLTLGASAYAQTGYKNDSNDWSMVSYVSGSHGEVLGKMFAAPNSTLLIDGGKVSHGAGKFVAEPNQKEVIACSVVGDENIDFVALDVSALSWSAFGYPAEITLRKPSVTYHLTADKSNNLVEQDLLVDAKYPGFNIVNKSDAVVLNEIAGKVERTPTMFVSFNVKSPDKSIRKSIGLFLQFNECTFASSTPTPKSAVGRIVAIGTSGLAMGQQRRWVFVGSFAALLIAVGMATFVWRRRRGVK